MKRSRFVSKYICGLGESHGHCGSRVHVFCNGRLILEGDKTSVTVWGEKGDATIPQYHPHFNYSEVYVYFDSDDAGKLPWNTTKQDSILIHNISFGVSDMN